MPARKLFIALSAATSSRASDLTFIIYGMQYFILLNISYRVYIIKRRVR